MITPKASPDRPKDLRRRAQARLKSRTAVLEKISPEEAKFLFQELQVHQVELEMQNEEIRRTQAELETALARYTDLYDFAPVAYLTLDDRGWVLEANLTAARLLGTERSRLVQQPLAPFIRPEDIKQFRAYLLAVIQGQAAPPLELHVLANGRAEVAVQLDSLLVPDAAGHPQVRTSLIDVTARKQAEETLRETRNYLEKLLDYANAPIIVWDSESRITRFNNAFEHLTGYAAQEVVGRKLEMLFPEASREESLSKIARSASGEYWQSLEISILRKDGDIRIALWNSANILDRDGTTLVATIAQGQDITDRKQAEEGLAASYEKLRRALSGTVQALSATVETRDPYTCGHQRRVVHLAGAISQEMKLSQEQVEGMQALGLLHDIGKVAVPAEILSKPGKLSEMEFNLIKAHPQAGYDILKDIEFPWPIALAVLQHHERLDGSGYPQGLTGPDILLEARILAVADVVEAMASHRPYRPALGIDQALEEISQNRGVLYDPEVVDVCVKLFTEKTFQFD